MTAERTTVYLSVAVIVSHALVANVVYQAIVRTFHAGRVPGNGMPK